MDPSVEPLPRRDDADPIRDLRLRFGGQDHDSNHFLLAPTLWQKVEQEDPTRLVEAVQIVADATSKDPEWRPLVGEAISFLACIFHDLKPGSRPPGLCKQYLRIIANSVHEDCEQARRFFIEQPDSPKHLTSLSSCLAYPALADYTMAAIMNLCVENVEAQRLTLQLGITREIARSVANQGFSGEQSIGYQCAINYFYLASVDSLLGAPKNQTSPNSVVGSGGSLIEEIVATYEILQQNASSNANKIVAYDSLRVCLLLLQNQKLQHMMCRRQESLVALIKVYKIYACRLGQILQLPGSEMMEALDEFQEIDDAYVDDENADDLIRQKVVEELNRTGLPKGCRRGQLLLTDAIFERLIRICITDLFVEEANAQKHSSSLLPELRGYLANSEVGWVHDALCVLACSLLANAAENIETCRYLVEHHDIPGALLSVMDSATDPTLIHATAGLVRCLAKANENRMFLGKAGLMEQCIKFLQTSNENARLQSISALHLLAARCLPNVERLLDAPDYPAENETSPIRDNNPSSMLSSILHAANATGRSLEKIEVEIGKSIVAILRVLHTSNGDEPRKARLLARLFSHTGVMAPIFVLVRHDTDNLRLEGLVGALLATRTGPGAAYLADAVNQDEDIIDDLERLQSGKDLQDETPGQQPTAVAEAEKSNARGVLLGLLSESATGVLRHELHAKLKDIFDMP